jgi:phosphatidylglycerophosphate synthase
MIHALVFDTDAPLLDDDAPASKVAAEARLAGLTLLRRAILMAEDAGAASATVVAHDTDELQHPPGEWRGVLILSAQVLPQSSLLERLLEGNRAACSVAAVSNGATSSGPALLRADDLRVALAAGESPTHAVARLRRAATPMFVERSAYKHLLNQAELAEADRDMYRGMTSPSDGYIDRVFNRHISRWVTRRIINLPITPNQITWFHLSLGLLAAWLFWRGEYVSGLLGAVLLQLSVALDCTDGEVARLKLQRSRFGSQLDVAADNIVNVAVFAAIANAAAAHYGARLALTLGALSVVGVGMCVLVVLLAARAQSRLRPGEASSFAVTNRLSFSDPVGPARKATPVDAIIDEVTSRDFSVIIVAFAVVGRLEWFAWLAAVGSHVFWVTFGAIQLSMLRTASAKTS